VPVHRVDDRLGRGDAAFRTELRQRTRATVDVGREGHCGVLVDEPAPDEEIRQAHRGAVCPQQFDPTNDPHVDVDQCGQISGRRANKPLNSPPAHMTESIGHMHQASAGVDVQFFDEVRRHTRGRWRNRLEIGLAAGRRRNVARLLEREHVLLGKFLDLVGSDIERGILQSPEVAQRRDAGGRSVDIATTGFVADRLADVCRWTLVHLGVRLARFGTTSFVRRTGAGLLRRSHQRFIWTIHEIEVELRDDFDRRLVRIVGHEIVEVVEVVVVVEGLDHDVDRHELGLGIGDIYGIDLELTLRVGGHTITLVLMGLDLFDELGLVAHVQDVDLVSP